MLALAAIIPSGARRSDSAAQQSRASEFAAAEAEELLDTNYSDGTLSVGSHDDPDNPHLQQYYVQWNVEGDQPITNCKRITITVRRSSTLTPAIARLVILKPQTEVDRDPPSAHPRIRTRRADRRALALAGTLAVVAFTVFYNTQRATAASPTSSRTARTAAPRSSCSSATCAWRDPVGSA